MEKWFGFALLGISIFVVNPLLAQSDSMQSADNDMSYHCDKDQNIYYNYGAVYDFINDYSRVENKIPEKEWKDLEKGKYRKLLAPVDDEEYRKMKFYKYAHKGIVIYFSNNRNIVQIWGVIYKAKRLPQFMQNKQYFLDKFNIKGLSPLDSSIKLSSEGGAMIAVFKGERLVSLEIERDID